MRDFSRRVLERARAAGASYADVRMISSRQETVAVKNGKVDSVSTGRDRGFGVRVLADGAWGFAASATVSPAEADRTADLAVRIARASARAKEQDVVLSPLGAVEGRWRGPARIDPFEVKLEDKLALLLDAEKRMHASPEIRVATAGMTLFHEDKVFASTEGSYIDQSLDEAGGVITAVAARGGEVQNRSYPAQFGGDFRLAGYEWIEQLDFAGQAERVAREAVALLDAEQCPSGHRDLILEGSQLGLQIHESCGHPIELDRVLGTEAGFVGKSFLTTDLLGSHFRYGSDQVTITADATVPGGAGSFGYDDEGVPAQRTTIVDKGVFQGYLTSRETAPVVGQVSNGTMRAVNWDRIPLIRMTNINLEPGDWSLDEIIKDTKDGIYMDLNKSYSIDDRRYNFQFGTEVAWEVKDGSLGRMLKNPTYTGLTPEFWGSLDAVAGRDEWRVWGIPNCGKGEPMQAIRVGHGAAPARFRHVRVGVGKW
ncbi:MAG: TldD/PmbA family protein [Bacillota bacterium]